MHLDKLKSELNSKNIKVLFTDYYDTIAHRTVHPNYTIRLWAKFMIIELGLDISIDALYTIRQESLNFICSKSKKNSVEIPYEKLIKEVYKRLINAKIANALSEYQFFETFKKIDIKTETNVQYLNNNIIDLLKMFVENGGKVYLVSDFYMSDTCLKKILEYHGISSLFSDVFTSASMERSKHNGGIYGEIVSKLSIKPESIMMIGDNKVSDYQQAIKNKLNAFLLKHRKYLYKNRLNAIGNDFTNINKVINSIYKQSRAKTTLPFTQYILFYHFFIERLYIECKKNKIEDLFFLSREGQFLKKLFDSYQDFFLLEKGSKINTHYLKISRQASLQIKLNPIDKEEFKYLKEKYNSLSVTDFLDFFNCPDEIRSDISASLKLNFNEKLNDFFNSETYYSLKLNHDFNKFYEEHRISNIKNFNNYINSFEASIKDKGLHLVDVGWGGTMQESLFTFFNEEVEVTGYYLGLREIYNISEKTKRFGLIFSVYPFPNYYDHILMANNQFYEQFSAANHGSVLCYASKPNNYVVEKYNSQEKELYINYIAEHQLQMFEMHKQLLKQLNTLCYTQQMIQKSLAKKYLVSGLFYNKKSLEFIRKLNLGFYQNVGTNNVGISYKIDKDTSILKYIKTFILRPELVFRYITKLKPTVYQKKKLLAFFVPTYLIYFYFLFNKFLRFRILKKFFLLKPLYFKKVKSI